MADKHNGSCLCGAVKFTVEPHSSEVGACHCTMCRHWSGGPLMVLECLNSLKFTDDEALSIYNSSDWAERGFCRECGSNLFYRIKESGISYVSVAAVEGMRDLALTTEVFIDEKPGFYAFAQETNQMTGAELFALFQGQDK